MITKNQRTWIETLAKYTNTVVGVYPRKNQVCLNGFKYMTGYEAIKYLEQLQREQKENAS